MKVYRIFRLRLVQYGILILLSIVNVLYTIFTYTDWFTHNRSHSNQIKMYEQNETYDNEQVSYNNSVLF